MKAYKYLFLIVLLLIPLKVNAQKENVIDLGSMSKICEAVRKPSGNSPHMDIIVYSPKKATTMEAPATGCSNSYFYNDNVDAIKNGSMQYVAFNASTSKNKIYIDDTLVKDSGKINEYSYFAVSNMERASTVTRSKTLQPTEKIVFKIDVSDKNIKTNKYKDLRLTIKYGATGSDVSLDYINSISYYLITKNKQYGPFKLDEANYVNAYQEQSTSSDNKTTKSKISVYDLVSKNLLTNVPGDLDITGIKIVPYEYYTNHRGYLRIFGISLDGYDTAYSSKQYVSGISNVENTIRHKVVDNMIENATIKWEIGGNNQLYFYNGLTSSPLILPTKTTFYGIPYVNRINSTINSFINQMTENKKTTSNPYFSYKLATPSDTKIGTKIGNTKLNNTLFVYEEASEKYKALTTLAKEIERSKKNRL